MSYEHRGSPGSGSSRLRDELAEKIQHAQSVRDTIIDQAAAEGRNLTPREVRRCEAYNEDVAAAVEHKSRLDEQVAQQPTPTAELRTISGDGSAMTASTSPRVSVGNEPTTYGPGSRESYFRDLLLNLRSSDPDANKRLTRHATEVRAVNRTDGSGGFLVPPVWLIDEYIAKLRAGRVTADRCTAMALPAQTDSINIPKITTGTAVAAQTADNAAVSSQDIVDAAVTVPVITIAGQIDASIQLVEQSALSAGFDQMIFQDLAADYAAKVDVQVLNGSGAAGQATGILNTAGITSTTYTDATPTVPELYVPVTQTYSVIASTRFLPPTAVVMHPRRWAWMLSALDSSNRPLVPPSDQSPFNPVAVEQAPANAEGAVGRMLGLPIFVDANIPTNLGAGVNEDRIVIGRFEDDILMEGEVRTRALTEILSGTLGVRFQLYRYVAFTAGRYALANGVISGSGLIGPAGF